MYSTGGPNIITRVLVRNRGMQKSQSLGEKKSDNESRDQRDLMILCAGFEDGGRGHEPRNAAFRSWKTQGNRLSS